MTASKWFAYASDGSMGSLCDAIRGWSPDALVIPETSPWRLRERLLREVPGRASAIVGPASDDVSPVNLASAIVADGHAGQVILVGRDVSGSLRSRASRAGIDRVLEEGEVAEAARAGRPDTQAEGTALQASPARVAGRGDVWDRDPRRASGSGRATAPSGAVAGHVPPDLPSAAGSDDLDEVDGIGGEAPSGTARRAPAGSSPCPILVFASGRGGVGKTAMVATTAQIAAGWGMRVAVVDLDLGSGNLFGFFGLPGAADLAQLPSLRPLTGDCVMRMGTKIGRSAMLWGPCGRPEMAELVSPLVGNLLSILSERSDIVLVDTSVTWTDAVAQAVQRCDRLLLVADERAGAVGSLARAGALAVRLGIARTRIVRVMNRCDPRRRDEAFLCRADAGLETARSFRVCDGGEEVAELLSGGHAPELAEALDNEFPSSVATCLAQLLSELGRLPDCEAARLAASGTRPRRGWGIFGHGREAS